MNWECKKISYPKTSVMNRKTDQLIRSLQQSFNGDPWYGESLMIKLKVIDPANVNYKAQPSSNSIARIVQHMINWRMYLIRKLQGDTVFHIEQNDENDWSDITINNPQDWEQLLNVLAESQEKLIELLSKKNDDFLQENVSRKSYDFEYLIEGIIQHDVYHQGQIAILYKLSKG